VEGRTWYTLTARAPLTIMKKAYTGEHFTALSLIFGTRRVKFFSNSSIAAGEYDKIITRVPLRFLGFSLPVTAVREQYRFYERSPAQQRPEEVQEQVGAALEEYLRSLVEPHGDVKSTLCTTRQKNGFLTVTLTAECEEEIGEQIPIYTEESGR
jgi:similar to stage IV sporulation protein